MKKIILVILTAGLFILCVILLKQCSENDLNKNKHFTIGYATGKGWSGGSILNYEYYINNEKIKGGMRFNGDYDLYIGKRYFVKFSSKYHGNAKILVNMPVPDSIKKAPQMGWDSIEFKKLFGEEK